jgi:WD40 repeat protein
MSRLSIFLLTTSCFGLLPGGSESRAAEPTPVLTLERSAHSLCYNPDGKILVTPDPQGSLRYWSLPDFKEARTIKGPKGIVRGVAFSPDGRILAAAAVDGNSCWSWRTTDWWVAVRERDVGCLAVAFAPTGKTFSAGFADGTIRLSGCDEGLLVPTNPSGLEGHTGFINAMAFSPDGKLLASCGRGPDLKLWETATGKFLADLETHENHVTGVAFSPDNKTLYSASLDGTVKLWDVATRKETATLKGPKDSQLTCMALSPDGKILAVGGNFKTVALWDTTTLKSLPALEGHTDDVLALAFAPDGKTLASSSKDRTVRFWKIGDK